MRPSPLCFVALLLLLGSACGDEGSSDGGSGGSSGNAGAGGPVASDNSDAAGTGTDADSGGASSGADSGAAGGVDSRSGSDDGEDALGGPTGVVIPARIEAEDYDRYNELEAPNDTPDCSEEAVDLGTTTDSDGGCYVGWTQPGEWVEYDVWVEQAAEFSLTLRAGAETEGQRVEVLVDGDSVGEPTAPGQGWLAFDDVTLERLELTAGAHVVRIAFVTGQVNLNYLVFELTGEGATPGGADDDAGGADDGDDTGGPDASDCDAAPVGYALAWSDSFDEPGLPDAARWGYETGGDGWGNNELQFYTDARAENASVADGVLRLTAIEEAWEGNTYTSAKLNSAYGSGQPGAWNEGIFHIRARLPAGRGTWPALWMMPTDCAEGWPNCGEIDIMEHVGYDEGVIHGTVHTDAFNHVEGTQNGNSTVVADATSAFHVYTLVWTADRLEWQVDGAVYHTIEREAGWGFAEWPFADKAFHLKMNLAVGGDWGGADGVDAAAFPTSFDVDYVCVYQAE